MSVGQALVTAEEFKQIAVDRGGLVELVRGEVVDVSRPGAKHGYVCNEIGRRLGNWASSHRAGRVVSNDAGIQTEHDPDTVRGPDVYFIREERLPDGKLPDGWLEIPPDLCIEVLSPHDRWKEVLEKIDEYFTLGVPEVWVLDPNKQEVHTHLADARAPTVLDVDKELTSEHLPGFSCNVSELFEGC